MLSMDLNALANITDNMTNEILSKGQDDEDAFVAFTSIYPIAQHAG